MPRLWNDTIEAHTRAVREATLDATAALVTEKGLRSVTMAQIAKKTGVGRATLYKYFPDFDAIITAWHARQVTAHLHALSQVCQEPGKAGDRLEAVLQTVALISRKQQHGSELSTMLHQGEHVAKAHQHLMDLIRDLISEGAKSGDLRKDVSPDELACYSFHALAAANILRSKASVARLVSVILTGLRRPGAR